MASLTVRQLEERLKTAAAPARRPHGRSMEDEVRTILREAAEETGHEALDLINPPAPKQAGARPRAGGGEARAADHRRRHRRLQVARSHPAAEGARRRRALRAHASGRRNSSRRLSAGALAGGHVFTDLFDTESEFDVGHIRLAREADLIVVAPATADLMAKMANGHADDLATAVLLATTAKILLAPAMNTAMWANAATQRNLQQLVADGVQLIGPNVGEMAEAGERGRGRMAEPLEIAEAAMRLLKGGAQPLKGRRMLVTSGPTHEPIDPVRYIANRSSGKQGHAIAAAAAAAGAAVTLVSGPVTIPDPPGVTVVHVESARDMLKAVEDALPADVAIFAAAVADWRVANAGEQKIKKKPGQATPELALTENPDILSTIAHRKAQRPPLVIGFAAETENVVANAKAKLARKGCDWILANDVSPATGIMGGDTNTIQFVRTSGVEAWPPQSKEDVAAMLIERIAATLAETKR